MNHPIKARELIKLHRKIKQLQLEMHGCYNRPEVELYQIKIADAINEFITLDSKRNNEVLG